MNFIFDFFSIFVFIVSSYFKVEQQPAYTPTGC